MEVLDRQKGIFDAEAFGDTPVHVVGVGGIGSHLALRLIDMRVRHVHVWDGDVVEAHNVQNQVYTQAQCIGKKKVDALQSLLYKKNGAQIETHDEYVSQGAVLSGVVCLCVDSMETRKVIWQACIRNNPEIFLMIDARMDASLTTIFTLDPRDPSHQANWDHFWFPSSEAQHETMACGSPLAVGPTASRVADDAMWQLIRYQARRSGRDVPLYNMMWTDLWSGTSSQESWENPLNELDDLTTED